MIAALQKAGFAVIPGRGKGSHTFLYRPDPPTGLTVPKGEIGRGLLRVIIRQAGMTVEEFLKLLSSTSEPASPPRSLRTND